MKGAVLEDWGKIVYQDLPTPEPGPGEVLLHVKAVSICGSDIKRYIYGHHTYPMVLGHEVAGVVASVGEETDESLVGQRVSMVPLMPEMDSRQAQRGLYSAAPYAFLGSRGRNGGFAEYVALPAQNIIPVPDDVPFEAAALVEPSTVAVHAYDRSGFTAGQSVAVLGNGSIGLLAVQWGRILGASAIIGIDVDDEKLRYAHELGATHTLNPLRDDVVARIKEITGDGVDIAHEMAGAAQTLELAQKITRPRGTIVLTGNLPADSSFAGDFFEQVMRKEQHINGSWMSYSAPFPGHEWADSLQAMRNGSLDTDTLISHRFPLEAASDVFEQVKNKAMNFRKIMLFPEA
jgi:L-iditol 2-dehydrogenase